MKRLPMYKDSREEPAPWEQFTSMAYDNSCEDCVLGTHERRGGPARTRCMGAEGYPGGVLVVGDYPGRDEDYSGRPFYGQAGRYIRSLIDQHWSGPVAYDNAVRCTPGRNKVPDVTFKECAPYLKHTIEQVRPDRIIAAGSHAMRMLLGRKVQVLTNRRGFGFTSQGVPVFLLPNPVAALRNRFIREWYEDDIKFALTTDVPKPPWDIKLRMIETEADALEAEAEIIASGVMVYDVETIGPLHDSAWFRIVSLAACSLWSDEPFVWTDEAIEDPRVRAPLKRLLTSQRVGKIGSNVKYDMLACRSDPRLDVVVSPITFDTRVGRKLVFSDADAHLDVMMHLVGMGGSKGEMKEELAKAKKSIQKFKKKHGDAPTLPGVLPPAMVAWLRLGGAPERFIYGLVPPEVLHRYNGRDTVATRRLTVMLKPQVDALPHVARIWEKVVGPAVPALEQVEAWGMPYDVQAVNTLGAYLRVQLDQSLRRIQAHKPGLDPSKKEQLRDWIYGPVPEGGLGLKPKKLTKTKKPSVDAESLAHLEDSHPAMKDILSWAKLDKLRGTYVDGMRTHIGGDGRIHPSLNLDGARSGRLSCSDPNLQNIPRAKGLREAKMVKDCFRAESGKLLLQADYSQLELRVAAMLSGDERMIEIFKSGEDYHLRCAKLISQTAWGVHPDNVLPGGEYRSKAKGFVFGLLYGMTDGGLARRMGCTKQEAARIRKAVLGSFPQLAQWIRERLDEARKTGWTYTWWDGQKARQRTLWQVAQQGDDDDAGARITAENSSFNTPCQGTASDFCLASVVSTVNWLLEEMLPAKLVITVHDSIILEVEEDSLAEVAYGLHSQMTQWNSNGVPLVVDMEVGKSWGSLVDYRYHGVQQDGTFDKRYTERKFVDRGVEAVWVRTDKDATPWLHRYEFNPVKVPERDAVAWLKTHANADTITHPWPSAA